MKRGEKREPAGLVNRRRIILMGRVGCAATGSGDSKIVKRGRGARKCGRGMGGRGWAENDGGQIFLRAGPLLIGRVGVPGASR